MAHPYLNLQLGLIEQYSKCVPAAEVAKAQAKGWLTEEQVGLTDDPEYIAPESSDEVYLFNRPTLLKEVNKADFIGQTITGFCPHLGTYGMGGPGFFGFELEHKQYLTYAVWGAGDYILFNPRVLTGHPNTYAQMQPLLSNFSDQQFDQLTPLISGATLHDWQIEEHQFILQLKQGQEIRNFIFFRYDSRIPRIATNPGIAYKEGVISDYLVLQDTDAVLYV